MAIEPSILGSVVFCIGAVMQTSPSHSLAHVCVGLVPAGAIGTMAVVVLQYDAEMSRKEIRGRLGSFFQSPLRWDLAHSFAELQLRGHFVCPLRSTGAHLFSNQLRPSSIRLSRIQPQQTLLQKYWGEEDDEIRNLGVNLCWARSQTAKTEGIKDQEIKMLRAELDTARQALTTKNENGSSACNSQQNGDRDFPQESDHSKTKWRQTRTKTPAYATHLPRAAAPPTCSKG